MSLRRVRIKGIANIPQRKKSDEKSNIALLEQKEDYIESNYKIPENNKIDDEVVNESRSQQLCENKFNVKEDERNNKNNDVVKSESEPPLDTPSTNIKQTFYRRHIKPIIPAIPRKQKKIEETNGIHSNKLTGAINDNISNENLPNLNCNSNDTIPDKITCNLQSNKNSVTKSTDVELKDTSVEKFLKPGSDISFLLSKTRAINRRDESDSDLEQDSVGNKLLKNVNIAPNFSGNKRLRSSLSESAKSGSDIEYPAPPSSPSKLLGRSRIKAVPCLTNRRISFSVYGSASESEDEGRRNFKRIRTDSVSSVLSCPVDVQPKTPQTPSSPQKCKESSSTIKNKSKKSEQYRKMAEARREFNMKFSKGVPDKQKLTMLDLIFYNPVTNPMSQQKTKVKEGSDENVVLSTILNKIEDETKKIIEEESLQKSDKDNDDEIDNDVLAPQIKIGPDGEIIVDEKSLVIENKEVKKHLENLQKSTLIDGDFDTDFKGYKKSVKSKSWTKSETFRFFKALNSIGTDFSIMTELFPHRTRKELKKKFTKEERNNPNLITKVLTCPTEFDMADLRRDLMKEIKEKEEKIKRELEAAKVSSETKEKEQKKIRKLGFSKIFDAASHKAKKVRKIKKNPYTCVINGINSVLESDSENETRESMEMDTSSYSESSDEERNLNTVKNFEQILIPTRSGRIPKPAPRFNPEMKSRKTIVRKCTYSSINANEIDFSKMESGTIVFLTNEELPNKRKVYMTIEEEPFAVELSDEMIESLSNQIEPSDCSTLNHNQETNNSATLNAHIVQNSDKMGLSLSLNNKDIETVSANMSDTEQKFFLPVNMSELCDVNLTIAHTEEIDLKKDKNFNKEENTDFSSLKVVDQSSNADRKINIKENIVISSALPQFFNATNTT